MKKIFYILALISTLQSCSWALNTFFPTPDTQKIPPTPIREVICAKRGIQIIGPSELPLGELIKYWEKRPELTIYQMFSALLMATSHVSPHLVAPHSYHEIYFLPKDQEKSVPLWAKGLEFPLQFKSNAELYLRISHTPGYSSLEERKLIELLTANSQVSPSLAELISTFQSKLTKSGPRTEIQPQIASSGQVLGPYQKKNGRLLNAGDPLPKKDLVKLWNLPFEKNLKPLSLLEIPLSPSPSRNQQNYTLNDSLTLPCQGPASIQEPSKFSNNLASEVISLAVVSSKGEVLIGQFTQGDLSLAPSPHYPFWIGAPHPPMSIWCGPTQEEEKTFFIFNHNSEVIGPFIQKLAMASTQLDDILMLMAQGRLLQMGNPSYTMVESQRFSSDQMKEILKWPAPVYHSADIGEIWAIKYKNQFPYLVRDERMHEDLVCQ